MYKFQKAPLKTRETFWITNVLIQFFPFYHSQRKKEFLKLIMFYF